MVISPGRRSFTCRVSDIMAGAGPLLIPAQGGADAFPCSSGAEAVTLLLPVPEGG